MKKYPQKIKSKVKIEYINEILLVNDTLIDAGIITPRIIRTLDGSGGFVYNGNIYSLYEFVDMTNRLAHIDMHEAGLFLSKLHSVLSNINMKDFELWSPTIFDYQYNKDVILGFNEYLGKKEKFSVEEKRYLQIKGFIESYLIKYPDYLNKVKKQLIHGDLYPGNIVKVNNEIGIIDLDTVHYGNCIIDYAVLSMRDFTDLGSNIQMLVKQYKMFKESYASGEDWSSELIFEIRVYELLSQMISIIMNWNITSRFTSYKRALVYFCDRIDYFNRNRELFIDFL